MALDGKANAALCLHRFGLGPRAGSIEAIASDPRGALMAEIDAPDAGRISDPTLLTGAEDARAAFKFRQEQRAQRLAARAAREGGAAKTRDGSATPDMKAPDTAGGGGARPAPQPGPGLPQR